MAKFKKDLFCYFSGFAQQDIIVHEYRENVETGIVVLTCINKGKHQLYGGDYIQLDGVLFEVIETNDATFTASSTLELIAETSIKGIRNGHTLTLGILAEKDFAHDCLWMLQPSAVNQITYRSYSVLKEHQHTLKLNFDAPILLSDIIQTDRHLGLAGCSLTAKEVVRESNLLKFSIYCGRETRENSQFNHNMKPGTKVNITEGAAVANRSIPK